MQHKIRKFDGCGLFLGIAIMAIPLLLAWYLSWEDIWFCQKMLASGIESTAKVELRDTLKHHGARGRTYKSHYSILQYDGYRGNVPFWVNDDTVSVIHPKNDKPPKRLVGVEGIDHSVILIGKKSDGFFKLFSENFRWTPVVSWFLINVVTIAFGLFCITAGLGFRAQYVDEHKEEKEASKTEQLCHQVQLIEKDRQPSSLHETDIRKLIASVGVNSVKPKVFSNFFKKRPHFIPVVIITIMLIGALGDWPYGYYTFLRIAVCGVSFYMIEEREKLWAVILFGFIIILFNPIIPIHLPKDIWQMIDLTLAVLFIIVGFIPVKSYEVIPQNKKISPLNTGDGSESVYSCGSIIEFESNASKNNDHKPKYWDFG